jgi:hypothetical protein
MAHNNPYLWRGNIRGRTRGLHAHCVSLLNYGAKHTIPLFLDDEEEAILRSTMDICNRILSDTRFPAAGVRHSSQRDASPLPATETE